MHSSICRQISTATSSRGSSYNSQSNITTTVLNLYRQCLKSMKRIPDPEQRQVYNIYIRDGFRSKQNLIPESKQAKMAILNAKEHLEQMNYYHSIREMKEREKLEQQQQHKGMDSLSNRPDKQEGTIAQESASSSQESLAATATIDVTAYLQAEEHHHHRHQQQCLEAKNAVQQWLLDALPHLHPNDLEQYTMHLIQEGFDSIAMLEQELTIADLDLMKTAHRRALIRSKQNLFDSETHATTTK